MTADQIKAVRPDVYAIFLKRSSSIHSGMVQRAIEQYKKVPFTVAEFREWLLGIFDHGFAARCEYSNVIITVENFSVDHKQPVSRGGVFGFANLALCTMEQNLRKGNMTVAEYMRLVAAVNSLPQDVQQSIWKRLEVGDVQRYAYFARLRKAKAQGK